MSEIFIVGNGPSLKNFDFNYLKDKTWIGMCAGFRHWEEIDMYPTHYCCIDSVVCNHHRYKILDMIENNKCKSFMICGSLFKSDIGEKLQSYKNVLCIQQYILSQQNPFRYLIDYCTGSTSVLYGYCLGAKKINILGCDCEYIEFIPECVELEDKTLKIIKEPENNPNYYYNKYQQIGDIYNKPNTDKVHKSSWFDVRNIILLFNILRDLQVEVYNYNTTDKLDEYFQRKNLNELK